MSVSIQKANATLRSIEGIRKSTRIGGPVFSEWSTGFRVEKRWKDVVYVVWYDTHNFGEEYTTRNMELAIAGFAAKGLILTPATDTYGTAFNISFAN